MFQRGRAKPPTRKGKAWGFPLVPGGEVQADAVLFHTLADTAVPPMQNGPELAVDVGEIR